MAKTLSKTTETQNLPAMPGGQADVDTSGVGGVPFVTFISAKSPRYAELQQALPGLQEPDAVLVRPQPLPPMRLAPLKIHLFSARQYWAEIDEDGSPVEVVTERPEWGTKTNLKEVVEAIVLAYAGERIVPARMTFKTTKCPGAKEACKALQVAGTPEWFTFGDSYAATANIPSAFARFTATFSVTGKTARSTGRKYFQADARIAPTTPAEYAALVDTMQRADNLAAFRAVQESYSRRIDVMEQARSN